MELILHHGNHRRDAGSWQTLGAETPAVDRDKCGRLSSVRRLPVSTGAPLRTLGAGFNPWAKLDRRLLPWRSLTRAVPSRSGSGGSRNPSGLRPSPPSDGDSVATAQPGVDFRSSRRLQSSSGHATGNPIPASRERPPGSTPIVNSWWSSPSSRFLAGMFFRPWRPRR